MNTFDQIIQYAIGVVYGEEEVPDFLDPEEVQEITARLSTWVIESFIRVEAEAEENESPDDETTTDEKLRELMEVALSVAFIIGRMYINPTNPTEPNQPTLPTVLNAQIVQRLLTTGSVTLTLNVDD